MMTRKQISVLLVDDHAVVRQGYRHLLESADIVVVGESSSGEHGYQAYFELKPDVVIMDLSMTGIGGLETLRRIVSRDTKANIVIFSMHDSPVYSSRALQSGAKGYVSKASAPEVLVEAIITVAKGKRYISPDIAQQIAINQADEHTITNDLSAREFEVFQLLAKGLTLEDIAKTLHLDYKTIANTQTRLRQKLNVENGSQLVLAAIKLNILQV
ncbi:MAG: response regulator transcription factor [Methylophilus sp.]|nr:response regulator transcription factor [Methylophilus sp.]